MKKTFKLKLPAKFLTILIILIFSSSSILPSQPGNNLKQQFEKKISELLGTKVSVEDLKMEYATIHLTNVKIGQKESRQKPQAWIQKIKATTDFMSLLGGHLIMKDITIATASLNFSAEQFYALQKYKPAAKKASDQSESISDLPFLNLSCQNLNVNIKDQKSGRLLKITVINAEAKREKDSNKLDTEFKGVFKASQLKKPGSMLFNGKLTSKTSIEGDLANPKINGTAKIKNVKIDKNLLKQPVEISESAFSYNNKKIETQNLQIQWGNSRLYMSGLINEFDSGKVSLSYQIKPLAFGEISTAFISKNGLTISGNGTSKGTITGSNKNIKIKGSLQIPICNINAPLENSKQKNVYIFPFKNVSANYHYNGGAITINDAAADIFDGKLKGKGKVFPETNPVNFTMNLRGNGLKVEQFLSENSSQKKVVTGTANAEFNASGNSSGLKSMQGDGSFKMLNGHYQAPPVVTPVLSMLNLRQFSSGDIESGKGSFKLKNGIMNTNDLVFIAEAGKVYYRGQVGLDTSLSGKMSIIFDQNAVSKSRVLQEISLDGKLAKIPTRVEGTLLSPSFPGLSAQKLLELGLKRKGQKMIQDILLPGGKKDDSTETETQQEQKRPEEQLLEGLQNIFKQKMQPSEKGDQNTNKTPEPEQSDNEQENLEDKLKNIFKF